MTPSGFIEGWAADDVDVFKPLVVAIEDSSGTEVASGLAHRFRDDLLHHKIGCGWHGFRVKTRKSAAELRRDTVVLRSLPEGDILHQPGRLTLLEDAIRTEVSLGEFLDDDPFVTKRSDALNLCEVVMQRHVQMRGPEHFVRAAYLYALGRPADADGIILYTGMLRKNIIGPLELLKLLTSSDEFHANNRVLSSPMTAGFIFK